MDRWDKDRKNNLALLIVCLVLLALLAGVIAWGKREDSRAAANIQKLMREENNTGKQEMQKPEKINKEESTAEELVGDKEEKPEGIVCWGDDLLSGEDSTFSSYQVVIQELLAEQGYAYQVQDKTLQGAGTLSMMTMAGVAQETIDGFRNRHLEAAAGAELHITETGVRDLTDDELARTDLKCIPVIFMGYYGGWNHDPSELIEQQEAILQTFPDTERFVIAGTRSMDGTVSTEAMDTAMKEKWGERYISVDTTLTHPATSYEGQRELAEAVLKKLEVLGYLEK